MIVVIVAHQGGWDEALVVAVPIVVFGVILWFANRRAAEGIDGDAGDESPE